jgi:hypothetical protein
MVMRFCHRINKDGVFGTYGADARHDSHCLVSRNLQAWWGWKDSNLRTDAYERTSPAAWTNFSGYQKDAEQMVSACH